ncbi:MAG: TMEM165/GDT1 family protein [Acidimicrobiales bacterium]
MQLSVLAVTFGLIFVAELPDKTMIASIVLGSRYSPVAVWTGTASAMVVNSAVAVAAGRLLELLPHRVVDVAVAALFAGGALYLLWGKESEEEVAGEETAARVSGARVAAAAFGTIVVAEIGDITQVLTANLAAHYRQPWSVFVGATVALVAVTTLGVFGGRALVRVVPFSVIRKVAGALLLGFCVVTSIQAAW